MEVEAFDPKTKKSVGFTSIPKVGEKITFALLFFESLEELMKKNISISLLFQLVKRMDDKNLAYLNSTNKREMATSIGIQPTSLDVYLTKMVDQQVLVRVGTGTYMVNPDYFGKGSAHKTRALRVVFESHLIDPVNSSTTPIVHVNQISDEIAGLG
jgi:hypothetical protein